MIIGNSVRLPTAGGKDPFRAECSEDTQARSSASFENATGARGRVRPHGDSLAVHLVQRHRVLEPYDNTGNLTVCVVNQDAGGSSELTGELNVGERIVDQLHENDQLHWEFTDYDAAMNELKSGRAYAAYVIPEHFTADLLTITTGSFTQPKIEYYVNEKSGPGGAQDHRHGRNNLGRDHQLHLRRHRKRRGRQDHRREGE